MTTKSTIRGPAVEMAQTYLDQARSILALIATQQAFSEETVQEAVAGVSLIVDAARAELAGEVRK